MQEARGDASYPVVDERFHKLWLISVFIISMTKLAIAIKTP
jgi:hypothetical protein